MTVTFSYRVLNNDTGRSFAIEAAMTYIVQTTLVVSIPDKELWL